MIFIKVDFKQKNCRSISVVIDSVHGVRLPERMSLEIFDYPLLEVL
jgi:hypothetical protein